MRNKNILQSVVESSQHGWWQLDKSKEYIAFSENMLQLLGAKSPYLAIDEFIACINETHRAQAKSDFENLAMNYYFSAAYPVKTVDGDKWLLMSKLQAKPDQNLGRIELIASSPEKYNNGMELNSYVNQLGQISEILVHLMDSEDKSKIIDLILRSWLDVFQADKIAVYKYDFEKQLSIPFFEQKLQADSPEDSENFLTLDEIPWLSNQILSGNSVPVLDMDEISSLAPVDCKTFKKKGIKSLLAVPVYNKDGVYGHVEIDRIISADVWQENELRWLQTVLGSLNVCLVFHGNEENVVKEEKYVRELFQKMPIGYISSKLLFDQNDKIYDYIIEEVSPEAQQILSLPSSFVGRKGSEVVSKDGFDSFIVLVQEIFDHNSPRYFNRYYEATKRYCSHITYQLNKNNITSFITDISEIQETNNAIDINEKLLRNMISNLPIALELYDKDGLIIDINHECEEVFGIISQEEINGLSIFDEPNYPDEIKEQIRTCDSVSFRLDYSFDKIKDWYGCSKSGSIDLLAFMNKIYDKEGQLCNYVLTYIDKTESNEIYRKLEEFEQKLNQVSTFSGLGYSTYDFETRKGSALPQWFANLNENNDAEICDVIAHFNNVSPNYRTELFRKIELLKTKKINRFSIELSIEAKAKLNKWIRLDMMREQGNGDRVVIISYDITSLKETEQLLLLAKEKAEESDKLKMAFLANMGHEIRTPLNAIVGFSSLLHETEDEQEREEYVNVIKANNESLLRLIGDILDLSKIESGSIEVVPVRFDMVKHMSDIYNSWQIRAAQKNITLHLKNPYKSCFATLDRKIISQIEANYMSNAIKYTPDGSITMGLEIVNNGIKFSVTDTGIGVPEERLPDMFKRFGKIDSYAHGNGLGLSICKALVNACNGEVGVSNNVNGGSTFWAWIPSDVEVIEESSETNIQSEDVNTETTSNLSKLTKILVAEDNDSNYILTNAILRQSYELTRAVNGEEAVKMAKEEVFDAILMDIRMPVMDGLEATRCIREFDENILIIALTANAFEEDKANALKAGVNYFMSKPLKRKELEEVLEKKL